MSLERTHENFDQRLSISCIGVLLLAAVVGLVSYNVAYRMSQNETVATVTRLEAVPGKNSKYLVFTETEVFECTDSFVFWKFDSSDVYGKIHVGKTYQFQTAGWRVPFLSMYRNVLDAKPLQTPCKHPDAT